MVSTSNELEMRVKIHLSMKHMITETIPIELGAQKEDRSLALGLRLADAELYAPPQAHFFWHDAENELIHFSVESSGTAGLHKYYLT